MRSISSLQADKTKLIADATALVQRGLKTSAEKEQHRSLLADIDVIQLDLDALSHIERSLPAPVQTPAPHEEQRTITPPTPEERRARTNYVWRSYLKKGFDERIAEHRDLLSSSDSAGGAVVPESFQSEFISQSLRFYAPFVNYARVRWADTSSPVKVSRVDDRANGLYLITEGSGPAEVDPTDFSSTVLSYDQFSSGITKFSNQLLDDSGFDLVNLLSDLASVRFGRGLSRILTLGQDYTSSPQSTPNNAGIVSLANVADTTASLAAGIGWDDITNAWEALDPAFLPRATWMMSSATRNYLAQLEDSTSRPYFVPRPSADGLDMIMGKPIVINEDLGSVGTANAVPIIFADLYNGLQVAIRRLRLIVLRERFASTNESALITYTGVSSTALAPGAIQALKLAAS